MQPGEAVWSPSNLQDGRWWYWRATTTSEIDVPDPVKRNYDAWSQTGYFYTDFNGGRPPDSEPDAVKEAVNGVSSGEGPQLLWPPNGSVVDTPNPNFRVRAAVAEGDTIDFYFEVDRLPTFDGEFLQRSSDRPSLASIKGPCPRSRRRRFPPAIRSLLSAESCA